MCLHCPRMPRRHVLLMQPLYKIVKQAFSFWLRKDLYFNQKENNTIINQRRGTFQISSRLSRTSKANISLRIGYSKIGRRIAKGMIGLYGLILAGHICVKDIVSFFFVQLIWDKSAVYILASLLHSWTIFYHVEYKLQVLLLFGTCISYKSICMHENSYIIVNHDGRNVWKRTVWHVRQTKT